MNTEEKRLEKAVDDFSESMKGRLLEKLDEGFEGWDSEEDIETEDLLWRAYEKTQFLLKAYFSRDTELDVLEEQLKNCTDVSNFMMMLSRRFQKQAQLAI